jgi:hypothetical protein
MPTVAQATAMSVMPRRQNERQTRGVFVLPGCFILTLLPNSLVRVYEVTLNTTPGARRTTAGTVRCYHGRIAAPRQKSEAHLCLTFCSPRRREVIDWQWFVKNNGAIVRTCSEARTLGEIQEKSPHKERRFKHLLGNI